MKRALLLLLLTIALAGNRPAAAQIAIEVRGGASIGNDRAAASRLERAGWWCWGGALRRA